MAKPVAYSFYRPHKRLQYTGQLVNHKTGEVFTPPARTKQQFVDQCDINNIIKQYTKTGQFSHLSANLARGTYTDLPDPIEFQDSMNLVIQAENAFATLPSKVRARFGNDPAEFLAFIGDPANQDEAIKMGLAIDNRPAPEPETAPAGPTGGDGGKPPSEAPKAP